MEVKPTADMALKYKNLIVGVKSALTLKDGAVVYDLNGRTRPDWTTLPAGYKKQ